MKLKEFLETVPDRTVYIGAQASFLCVGVKDSEPLPVQRTPELEEMENPPLFIPQGYEKYFEQFVDHRSNLFACIKRVDEKLLIAYHTNKRQKAVNIKTTKKKLGKDDPYVVKLQEELKAIKKPVPLLEREVLETYERHFEDAINVMVTGKEVGKIWSVYEAKSFSLNYNLETIVGDVIASTVRDYRNLFRLELIEMKEILKRLKSHLDDCKGYERYFEYLSGRKVIDRNGQDSEFPTKLFTVCDPQLIIDQARRIVLESLMEEEEQNGNVDMEQT